MSNWIRLTNAYILCRWTYADSSWARIAALVPEVVSCAEDSDEVADKILVNAVQELATSVKAVAERLSLCGEGAQGIWLEPLILWLLSFPPSLHETN